MDLTILIPTMNRHEFLRRVIDYYKLMKFDGCLIIGDSSEGECLQKNMDLIAATTELNIIYRKYSNPPYLHDGMCVKEMNKEIPTKYAIFQGDDDLLALPGLEQCVEFLEQSSNEYVSAYGERLNIGIINDKPYGNLAYLYGYAHVAIMDRDADEPFRRWEAYVGAAISSQYWVHRTDVWKKMYEKANLMPSRYLGPEFLPCSLSALSGKAKRFECLTLIYQNHKSEVFDFSKNSLFDLMCMDGWPISMRILKQTLIDNGVPPEFAHSGLWFHIYTWLGVQFQRKYLGEEQNIDTGFLVNTTWDDAEIQLDSEWPYYKEFLPIFNFLTEDKQNAKST